MTGTHDTRPLKLIRPAQVARKGRVVTMSGTVALVFHPVTPPAYRGVFRSDAP